MKFKDVLRALPGGTASASVAITQKAEDDGATLSTTSSDATGAFTIQKDYGEQPFRWEATVNGVTRKGSSLSTGAWGPNWALELVDLYAAFGDGLATNGDCALSFAATRVVNVAVGTILVKGIIQKGYASVALTGTANATGSTRIDTVVLEVTRAGQVEEGLGNLKIVTGTASAPALTQTSAIWQFPIGNISLTNGGTVYTLSLDRRVYLFASPPTRAASPNNIARRSGSATISSTSGASISDLSTSVTLASGVVYDVYADANLSVVTTSGTVDVAVWLGSTAAASSYVSSSGVTTQRLPNGHFLGTVVGSGASYSAGVLVRKSSSGATASYTDGIITIRAVARS